MPANANNYFTYPIINIIIGRQVEQNTLIVNCQRQAGNYLPKPKAETNN